MQERDFKYWADLITRRRTIVLQVAGVMFGLITIGTLLWPPAYESTAKILVQDSRAQYLVSSDLQDDSQVKQAVVAHPVTEEDLNSEVELLTSTELIEQALKGLHVPAAYAGPGAGLLNAVRFAMDLPSMGYRGFHDTPAVTPRDRWALGLEREIHPTVIKRSNIIEVNFRSPDAKWSEGFLSRLLNEYLEYRARISHDPEAEQFFREQAQLLQNKLYSSEEQLRQFEVQNEITDLPAQKQALVNRLSDLQIQYNRAGAELASAHEQVATLRSQVKTTPERIGKETRSVQNVALQQLKPQVMQLKAERADLLSRYQPTSQRIQEIDAKLAAAQRILDVENHLEVQEKATDLNPVWVSLDTNLEQAKTTAAADQATRTALENEIQKIGGELIQMTDNSVTLDRLERQVTTDKEAYLSYVRKGEEARTAQALNLSKILNVSVVQPPSKPLRPVFPKIWLNLIIGLVLAAALGLGAAYWEEEADERIYSRTTIAEVSGLGTVAVLRDED